MSGASTGELPRANPRRSGVRALIALLALSASACSSHGYPSLARRPAERVVASPAPAVAPSTEPAAPSPELSARLAALLAKALEAHRSFNAQRPGATRAVAGAGALGSDSWASASIALAGLESAHAGPVGVIADLDELATTHRIERLGATGPGTEAIDAARSEVTALVAEEDDVLAGLRTRLGG